MLASLSFKIFIFISIFLVFLFPTDTAPQFLFNPKQRREPWVKVWVHMHIGKTPEAKPSTRRKIDWEGLSDSVLTKGIPRIMVTRSVSNLVYDSSTPDWNPRVFLWASWLLTLQKKDWLSNILFSQMISL